MCEFDRTDHILATRSHRLPGALGLLCQDGRARVWSSLRSFGMVLAAAGFHALAAGSSAPTVSAIQNNYGLIPQGLPNWGIAPGSLFFIKGNALANDTTDLQSSASPGLQTSLQGVKVSVTVGTTTVQCFLYYVSPTQIDAVLPGNTPLGLGTLNVTNNGPTSAGSQINVAVSAFGILSYNGTLAAAYDTNNLVLTPSNSANPNQTIVLWGSGVGGDSSNDDALFRSGRTTSQASICTRL